MKAIFKISNENGLGLKIVTDGVDDYSPLMGGMDSNPSWDEYLGLYLPEYHPHIKLIKEAVIKLGWIGKTGEEICNYHCFVFSDGTKWGYSWRAWGDLMQAIVNKKEGYMTYYM